MRWFLHINLTKKSGRSGYILGNVLGIHPSRCWSVFVCCFISFFYSCCVFCLVYLLCSALMVLDRSTQNFFCFLVAFSNDFLLLFFYGDFVELSCILVTQF